MVACSKDDDTVYSNHCYISGVTLGAVRRQLHTTTWNGNDSVYYTTFSGSNFPMTVDQRNLLVENKDSLLTYDKLNDITELNFQTQLNRTGEQVRILSYKRRMQGYLLGGVAAFALAIIAVLVGLAYNYRQLRTKNRQLYEKHAAMIAEMRKTSELQKKYDEQQKTKYSGSKLGGDTLTLLEHRIAQVLENSEEIYAEDFDIKTLADLTGSNQAYVSQVINTKYGKSFSSLLSEYRVNEASRRLADLEHYGDYTIEAIAQSVGFKSRTSFVALFKKLTGLTPSAYQKMARQG